MNIKVIDWSAYKGNVPGYGDCRAVPGEYACLFPDRYVESSFSGQTGRSALPGENINYLRIPANAGNGRMAGGGQSTDLALEWDVTHWTPRGAMFGPNGLIYGAADTLVTITSRAEYQRTAGWRYVDFGGVLHDCESTYADKARGVYEYTTLADVTIGQGGKPDMGAVVEFEIPTSSGPKLYEPLRRLDPRPVAERTYPFNARFMRSDRHGDQFGICIVDLGARKTYFCWPTLAELRDLSFVGAPMPVPPIPPQPPTPPKPPVPVPPTPVPSPTPPNPEPPAMDYLAINERVRAKYQTPLGSRHWEYLVDLAQQAGVQLYRKDGGANVLIPPLNVRVSMDVVGRGSMGNHWADTLRDAEGQAVPVWSVGNGPADGTYIDVSGVALPGQPAPGPGPTSPPSGQCEARVAELEQAVRQIRDIAARVL